MQERIRSLERQNRVLQEKFNRQVQQTFQVVRSHHAELRRLGVDIRDSEVQFIIENGVSRLSKGMDLGNDEVTRAEVEKLEKRLEQKDKEVCNLVQKLEEVRF